MAGGRSKSGNREGDAFTIIELLVATTVLIIILVLVFSVISQASSIWRRSSNKIEAFQSARAGFDLLTRNLGQATLNTYLDYDNATNPVHYLRKSELKFFVGQSGSADMPGNATAGQGVFFQAPLGYTGDQGKYGGLEALLSTCGYYVSYTTNSGLPPHVPTTRNSYRYRLMQMLGPTESNSVYSTTNNRWFSNASEAQSVPVADNVIALVVRPQDPSGAPVDLTSNYTYDSTANATNYPQPIVANQLPPVVVVTLVAIDEVSAARLDSGATPPGVIASALNGKFRNPQNYDNDLSRLENDLVNAGIDARVFSTAVPLRESKWTK